MNFCLKIKRSLSGEYASNGILIQSLCPTTITPKSLSSTNGQVPLTAPNADTYVKSALNTIRSHTLTNGYWAQNIEVRIICLSLKKGIDKVFCFLFCFF